MLRRLRAFQDAGHVAVLIVGDYTARIGDPSGRSKERRVLPDEVLDSNAELFAEQAFRILDRDRTEIRFNGEWLGKLDYAELVRLTRTGTVARLLERDDFAERFSGAGADLRLRAALSLRPGVRLGRDRGRHRGRRHRPALQPAHGPGRDAALRSRAAVRDHVRAARRDGRRDQDEQVRREPHRDRRASGRHVREGRCPFRTRVSTKWWRLALDREPPAAIRWRRSSRWPAGSSSSGTGEEAARAAEEHFTRVVREGKPPEEIEEAELPAGEVIHLPALLVDRFGLASTSEARRLIAQGGVRVDGEPVEELDVPREQLAGRLVQAGKRRFLRSAPLDRRAIGAIMAFASREAA